MSNNGRGAVQPKSSAARTHRPDIDGLRGLAVAGVVAYHFGLGVPGGYGGVDVFFVISGFLIAGIIKSELDAGVFSLAGFYVRRIRRILPAFIAMVAVTSLFAATILFPPDLKAYGRSLLGAVIAGSNYVFARETGYFNAPAADKPLLHTWSLSVEEQFYLVFPLLLVVLYRWRRGAVVPVLALIAISSFAYSVQMVELRPLRAFFITPVRVWELLVGVLLALGAVPRPESRILRELSAAAGLALILFGFFYFDMSTPFPGVAALAPCLGAMLMISAGIGSATSPTVGGRLLSLPPIVGMGLISYSVYLWHWPLMVFVQYRFPAFWAGEAGGSFGAGFALAAASVALGALSWQFVEQPFRRASVVARPMVMFASAAAAVASFAALSAGFIERPRWFHTWPDEMQALIGEQGMGRGSQCASYPAARPAASGWPVSNCVVGSGGVAADTVLWGDSHAAALIPGAAAYGAAHGRAIVIASYSNCPPLAGAKFYGPSKNVECPASVDAMMKRMVMPDVHHVVIAARWAKYAEGESDGRELFLLSRGPRSNNAPIFASLLEATVKRIAANGREVILIGPVPEQVTNTSAAMARHLAWGQPLAPETTLAAFFYRQRHVLTVLARLDAIPNVRVVYPHTALCDDRSCHYSKDDVPLYRDTNHLNNMGVAEISGIVAQAFADADATADGPPENMKPLARNSGTHPPPAMP